MTSVTVSAQMMPDRPNQRLPRITTGMKRTPCVTDIAVAAIARPVAWNSDVMQAGEAVRDHRHELGGEDGDADREDRVVGGEGGDHLVTERDQVVAEASVMLPTAIAAPRSADVSRARSPLP